MRQRRSIRKRDTIRSEQQRSADSIRAVTGQPSWESGRELQKDSTPKLEASALQIMGR